MGIVLKDSYQLLCCELRKPTKCTFNSLITNSYGTYVLNRIIQRMIFECNWAGET